MYVKVYISRKKSAKKVNFCQQKHFFGTFLTKRNVIFSKNRNFQQILMIKMNSMSHFHSRNTYLHTLQLKFKSYDTFYFSTFVD